MPKRKHKRKRAKALKHIGKFVRRQGPEIIIGVVTGVVSNLFTDNVETKRRRSSSDRG
jgi:hypothetical protein